MVLASQSFDGNRTLFAEIVGCSLGEGPLDESLCGDDLVGAWLVCVAGGWDDRVREIDLNVDVSPLGFKERFVFFLIDPHIATFLSFFDCRCASLKENALGDCIGSWFA